LAVAALLQLLVGDLPTGLGLTGLVVSPAFGYVGVGFPMLGMNAFAYAWGSVLPLRWYMEVLLGQGARGLPVSDSARPFAVLATLAALYVVLALLRLRTTAGRLTRRPAEDELGLLADRPGVVGAFAGEWQRVLAIRGAFILLIGAPLIYGVYYPQPYLNQILRKLPIAVVDADQTELSRRIVETVDASGATSVVARARTLADAQALIDHGDAFAMFSRAPQPTFRSMLTPLTCFFSDRSRAVSQSRLIHCHQSLLQVARAQKAASLRRRLPVQVLPTYCCNQSSIRSAATQATLCRQLSC
jgi:ABC-2 type transport system permease protein